MTRTKDAARADASVEARHREARAMVARFARYETLRETIVGALQAQRSSCLDNDAEVSAVADEVVRCIARSADARFLVELFGPDPLDRATRMHAHGALAERAAQAAWRLAGGE